MCIRYDIKYNINMFLFANDLLPSALCPKKNKVIVILLTTSASHLTVNTNKEHF